MQMSTEVRYLCLTSQSVHIASLYSGSFSLYFDERVMSYWSNSIQFFMRSLCYSTDVLFTLKDMYL